MRGFSIMVATIVSTVLHFFILTVFDTIPLISKEIPQRNLYMVDLIPLPAELPAPQKEEAAIPKQATEVKKEEVKKEEVKKEEVKKEEPKKETVKEEEVKKTPPKDDEVVLADQGNKQENTEKTEKQTPDAEEQLMASIEKIKKDVAARETDDASTGNQDYDYNKLENQVKRSWAIPDTLSKEGLKAVVVIEIGKNGEVVRTEFEQSSGNAIFDQAAIRAIKKAAPFDPPRGSVPLKIGLRFP